MRLSAVPSLLLLLPVGLCLSCHSGKTLAEEIELTRQAGIPTTPQELQAPLPPEDQNAAPLYVQLTALLKSAPLTGEDKLADGGIRSRVTTAAEAAQLRHAFAHRSDVGDLIHKAVVRPHCVFQRDWAQGSYVLLPEYSPMRMAARWLRAESALELYDGKPQEAIKTQALGFHIARHFAEDPTDMGHSAAEAADAITLAGMQHILYVAGDRQEVAQAVQQAIEQEWHPPSLAFGLRHEVVSQLIELKRIRKGGPNAYDQGRLAIQNIAATGLIPSPPSQSAADRQPLKLPMDEQITVPPALSADDRQHWDHLMDENGIVMMQRMRKVFAAADLPMPQADAVMKEVDADIKAHRQDTRYFMASTMFPDFEHMIERRTSAQAQADIVRTGATLLAWRAQHGAFPDKLSDALTTVPNDPFDGQPLHYKHEGDGCVVYSVGQKGTFDGGTPDKAPDRMERLFRYPAPAYLK